MTGVPGQNRPVIFSTALGTSPSEEEATEVPNSSIGFQLDTGIAHRRRQSRLNRRHGLAGQNPAIDIGTGIRRQGVFLGPSLNHRGDTGRSQVRCQRGIFLDFLLCRLRHRARGMADRQHRRGEFRRLERRTPLEIKPGHRKKFTGI